VLRPVLHEISRAENSAAFAKTLAHSARRASPGAVAMMVSISRASWSARQIISASAIASRAMLGDQAPRLDELNDRYVA
jgi:hypothetical protein